MYLNGERLEAAVVEAFFAALAPAQLDLLDEVLATQRADHQRVLRQHAEQVQRAEYEVRLAERQYMAVDNRLVAAGVGEEMGARAADSGGGPPSCREGLANSASIRS